MGSLLLAAGEAGMRHSLPNSRIMIHQPSGGAQVSVPQHIEMQTNIRSIVWFWFISFQGQATDIQIQAEEILRMKKSLTEIYSKHTKRPYDELYNYMERDKFLTPDEAKTMGLIDSVLVHPPSVPEEENKAK